ncbi:MAG: cation transporter [Nitrososphaerota archaeon]|jgi:cation diffusion facilitator family transporter|nr:cation transporter [Nitrososphaerota archaeon]
MTQHKKRRFTGDLNEFLLLILHNDGSQSIEQLREKTVLQTINFNRHIQKRRRIRHRLRNSEPLSVDTACEDMVHRGWIKLDAKTRYELTDMGQLEAEQITKTIEQGARRLETQILNPSAAARNTTMSYVVISILKMAAGLFSGSVGLIADGADTMVDTFASAIVWAGIKFKKEVLGTLTLIGLMFLTAGILFYNSFSSILDNLAGTFLPMTMPYVVITVELIAILSLFITSSYQRFVGKRSKSLSLITQSIDSKNGIYSAVAVIIGAIFSIFGIHWVDAIVGIFIATQISIDGARLIRETTQTMRGGIPEFSKFKLPFEKQIAQRRTDNFRHWILYVIYNNKLSTKREIVSSLEKTFQPNYVPQVFTEFTAGRGVNFDTNFLELIKPLLKAGYLTENADCYILTDSGKTYIQDKIEMMFREQIKDNSKK